MTLDPAALLPVAFEAVARASELVRTRSPGDVRSKGDRDMVSDVDYAVEKTVRAFLAEHTPDVGFLGEETAPGTPDPDRPYWTLDPVDGTANYLRGLPLCAVSLGLVHGNRPVLGVIDLPFLGTRYTAAEHHGAHRNGQPIHVSQTTTLTEAIVSVGDYAFGPGGPERNRLRVAVTAQLADQVQRVRMLGSAAIDLVWVAEGRLDASVMLANHPWDTAAGVVIAREAGARVLDLDGTDHTMESAATIATTPALADHMLGIISKAHAQAPAALER